MDLSEATRMVLLRIQNIEPDFATKIIGYLLLNDYGYQEMISLAFSTDLVLRSLVHEAKLALSSLSLFANPSLSSHDPNFASYPPTSSFHLPSPAPQNLPSFQRENDLPPRRRSNSMPEIPPRVCHYFHKGYCKHGANCRFLHGPMTSPRLISDGGGEPRRDEAAISSGSLERLELELVDLLKSRGRQPVSISVLPTLYSERYGKALQADGYLTESQRHGKAGFSLTRLLARLKNTIRILDRPHGQHAVMLVEDAMNEGNDPGRNVTALQQIYLTFPSESSFTEEDVASYFGQFGRVLDVRIPPQEKRMFGFVTFESQETAKLILSKKNPHYVCGSRVLVKPYKEKTRAEERKIPERNGFDSDSHSRRMISENLPGLSKRNEDSEEQDQEIEALMRRLSSLNLIPMPPPYQYLSEWDEGQKGLQAHGESSFTRHGQGLTLAGSSGDSESLEMVLPDDLFPFASEIHLLDHQKQER